MSFYILAGRDMPPAASYDGMPQYSNGIGMTRDFLDGWAKAQRRLPARMPQPTSLTLVCGTLIAPILQQLIDRLNAIDQLDGAAAAGGQSVLWRHCHRVRAADGNGCCAGPTGQWRRAGAAAAGDVRSYRDAHDR